MKSKQKKKLNDLLQRLNSGDAGAAWAIFIDLYSPLIMNTVRQFEYRQERSTECFLYVCEKLSERQFRRLLQFNTAGTAKFRNWLSTVVFNLCIDWHRAEFGRAVILPAISALPAFDQLVYRYCYVQGMSQDSCFQTIKTDFPELTSEQVTASLGRIHSLLTPRQRWQLSLRNRRGDHTGVGTEASTLEQLQDPGPDPDSLVLAEEEMSSLHKALSGLSIDHRLILQLRFQEGLTFKRIAEVEHLGNTHRARRQVEAALDALYIQLQRVQAGQNRQI